MGKKNKKKRAWSAPEFVAVDFETLAKILSVLGSVHYDNLTRGSRNLRSYDDFVYETLQSFGIKVPDYYEFHDNEEHWYIDRTEFNKRFGK